MWVSEIDAKELKSLLIKMKQYDKQADAWLDTVPPEINNVFFDNPYVDALQHTKDLLLHTLFQGPLLQEIEWFLYEWDADKPAELRTITYPDGATYTINSIEDFIVYLKSDGLI